MRGEHARPRVRQCAASGSSPHARGAPNRSVRMPSLARIIPACAGSTTRCTQSRGAQWDHPRMRGEHARPRVRQCAASGSSPHARGALAGGCVECCGKGIIPACAGSTRYRRNRGHGRWDHPRMRGEHLIPPTRSQASWGSSPHARGALAEKLGGLKARGIIPACAGSTNRLDHHLVREEDHPRMRGEHPPAILSICS